MVHIFSDRIRGRIRLEEFKSVHICVGIFNVHTVFASEYSNRIYIFMMSISDRILFDIADTICIWIRIQIEI
jgi:hypothetical protein